MNYFNFNEGKHSPEIIGGDTLNGYEIESVLLGGRLCKPTFGLEHLMFIQVIGKSKHPITKKTKTHAIGWGKDAPKVPIVLVLENER